MPTMYANQLECPIPYCFSKPSRTFSEQPVMTASKMEENWNLLSGAMDVIYVQEESNLSYELLYRCVF